MNACRIFITGDALRQKLGLPDTVRVRTVHMLPEYFDTYAVVVEGIGPPVSEGSSLVAVTGTVGINTDGTLEFTIR